MENISWVDIVRDGGAIAVLVIIVFLFARSYIVSRQTVSDVKSASEKAIEVLRESISDMKQTYEDNVKHITTAFNEAITRITESHKHEVERLCAKDVEQLEKFTQTLITMNGQRNKNERKTDKKVKV